MAAPFNVPLPAPGQKPWNLNPAVEEVRSRIGAVNDLTTTGRLSEANLNATIGTSVVETTSTVYVFPSGGDDAPLFVAANALAYAQNKTLQVSGTLQWRSNATPMEVAARTVSAGRNRATIQLGPGVSFGPRYRGSKVQVGGDNPISSVDKGVRVLTTGSDLRASLAVGDRIALTSGKSFAARDYYTEGEYALIEAISATQIVLRSPLRFSYATADTIKLTKYTMLSGVDVSGLRIIGHTNTTTQILFTAERCVAPRLDLDVSGRNAAVGIEVRECDSPYVTGSASDILDLANPSVNAWLGYGVRTLACLDAVIDNFQGRDCRHLTDDGSDAGLPPSFNTRIVGGAARDCRSSGYSTHGGSDAAVFDRTTAINCGGGYVVRGRGARGLDVNVIGGIASGTPNEYTALGGVAQNNVHALFVGEPLGGGTVSPGGTSLMWRFGTVDLTGVAGASVVFTRYADLTGARIHLGDSTPNKTSNVVYVRSNRQTDVVWTADIIRDFGAGIAFAFTPDDASVGSCQVDVVIHGISFDGYAARFLYVVGSSNASLPSKRIEFRHNRAKGRAGAFGASSSVFRFESGYFDTAAGAIRIQDNAIPETDSGTALSTAAGVNGGTGSLSTGLTRKGNTFTAGYDTAP